MLLANTASTVKCGAAAVVALTVAEKVVKVTIWKLVGPYAKVFSEKALRTFHTRCLTEDNNDDTPHNSHYFLLNYKFVLLFLLYTYCDSLRICHQLTFHQKLLIVDY